MSRNLHRSGISYMVSVLIITLILSSLASSVLIWGLGMTSESRAVLSSAQQARIERMHSRLEIESVDRINSTNLKIYVRNSGSFQIVVDQVYVNHVQAVSLSPSKLSLSIRGVGVLVARFNLADLPPGGFTSGSTHLVKVTTTRGASYSSFWTI